MAPLYNHSLLESESFKESLCVYCGFSQVEKLYLKQITGIKDFILGNNIFLSAGTGYGKSLVFQPIPPICNLLGDQAIGISVGKIICPVISLMLDQVAYLKLIGLNAAAVYNGQDENVLRDIEEGQIYSYIYATPESMLSVKRWQKML